MFELDSAITNWRNSLLANQNITDSNADELESHLRDEIDSLMLTGLNVEEAFMVAAHRIGDQQAVGAEFAKINPSLAWRRRAFWMFFGILMSMVVGGVAGLCSNGSAALLTLMGISPTSIVISVGVFLVLLSAVIFGMSLLVKLIKDKLTVSMALIGCVVSIFVIKAIAMGFEIVVTRVWGIETIGQYYLARSYALMTWNLLWPVLVLMLLFVLWSSRPQRVR